MNTTLTSASRRHFLKSSAASVAAVAVPYWFPCTGLAAEQSTSPSERLVVGCIGTGSRWNRVGPDAMKFADCVAVCDVDAGHAGRARDVVRSQQNRDAKVYDDYRHILDDDHIDIVTIATPDHWHSKIAIDAMRAGKDVYCEKPLTLTIHEGNQIIKVLEETNRVFQVGTQQRTEFGRNFLTAIALIREGRIGDVRRITCNIGEAPSSDLIPVVEPPKELNWEMWLGQAPLVEFRLDRSHENQKRPPTRCHYEFRWWYEYSGGKMTDWGAHHVDIAQWAIGQNGQGQGPLAVEGTARHPVQLSKGIPLLDDRFNTATSFDITVMFENVEMHIVSESSDGNGILFEGTGGRFHVSRNRLKGRPIEELGTNPLPEDAISKVYGGIEPTSHMENFINCVRSRSTPISDVWSHHRAMTTCHLANIAIRLGRRIEWDAQAQQIVGDAEANQWLAREQRQGYEIDVAV